MVPTDITAEAAAELAQLNSRLPYVACPDCGQRHPVILVRAAIAWDEDTPQTRYVVVASDITTASGVSPSWAVMEDLQFAF